MLNIVVIHGQNHKGCTWHLCDTVLSKITVENQIIEFFLPKDLNHCCSGCFACLKSRDKCPWWEEKKKITDAMLAADLIVLTTPNYCMMPSAPMKAFIDLFFTNWMSHKPYAEMFSKRALVVCTTAGMGAGKTAKLLKNCLENWGIPKIYTCAFAVNASSWETIPQKIRRKIDKKTRKIAANLSDKRSVKVGLKTKMMFLLFRGMQKADWGAAKEEKDYWQEMGWLENVRPWTN